MKLYSSLLDTYDVERYLRTVCRTVNLTMQFTGDVEEPKTDGKTIWLPSINSKSSPDQVNKVVGLAIHEGPGHVGYSDFELLKELNIGGTSGTIGMLMNAFEDHRIEWLLASDGYDGDRVYLAELMRLLNEKGTKSYNDAKRSGKDIPEVIAKYMAPTINWEQSERSTLFPFGGLWANAILTENRTSKEYAARYAKHAAGIRKLLQDAREIEDKREGGLAVLEVAKYVMRHVYEEDPDKALDEAKKAKGKGGESGEECAGNPGGDAEGEGTISNDEEASDSNGSTPKKGDTIIPAEWQEGMLSMHKPNLSGVGLKLSYSEYKRRGSGYVPCPIGKTKVVDLT